MKIILAHYKFFVQGGPERYMFNFIQLAEKHGHQVIPFSVNYNQNRETKYSKYFVNPINSDSAFGLNVSKLNLFSITKAISYEFHNKLAYMKLKALIQDEQPDLLYVLIPGLLTPDIFIAAKEANIPTILRISDFRLICGINIFLRENQLCEECINGNYWPMVRHRCVHNSIPFSLVRMLALRHHRKSKNYHSIDAVITPSVHTKKKFVDSGYFEENRIFINPTFINCSAVVPKYSHKNYVLCLGRFSPEKGFIYVVEALRYLKGLPLSVAITGNEESCDKQLKQIIEKYDLKSRVQFIGFQKSSEVGKIIANSLCVACPAIWYENLPNVILEAYAHGKPVIASNIGSLSEVVLTEETGLLFEPKNTKQIADCILRLYKNPEFCIRLGNNARREAETKYSPELHWKNLLAIYNKISV